MKMNEKMPKMPKGKYKATMNEYDSRKPKKPMMTKVCK